MPSALGHLSLPPSLPSSDTALNTHTHFLLASSQIDSDQVAQIDLEVSLITTWKDVQVTVLVLTLDS